MHPGELRLDLSYFDFLKGDKMYSSKFKDTFKINARSSENEINQKHMNIAASIQKVTEIIVINKIVSHALDLIT